MWYLNLPAFDYKIQKKKETNKYEIYDIIRKKYIALTPEEWVRQHMINYLINNLGYPKNHMSIESSLTYNHKNKRTDIIIHSQNGGVEILVECKAFYKNINKSTLNQATTYNKTKKAELIILTNGFNHFCFEKDKINPLIYNSIKYIPKYIKS